MPASVVETNEISLNGVYYPITRPIRSTLASIYPAKVVIGDTTKDGAFVNGEGYDVGHLFHTIFTVLGINSRRARYRNKGQKLAIAHDDCEPIKEVML